MVNGGTESTSWVEWDEGPIWPNLDKFWSGDEVKVFAS